MEGDAIDLASDREYFEAHALRANVLGDITFMRLVGGWMPDHGTQVYGTLVEDDFVARSIAETARERAAMLNPGDRLVVAFHVKRSLEFEPWQGNFDAWFAELKRVAVADHGFTPRAAAALLPDTWRVMYFEQRITPARAIEMDLAEG